MGHKSTPAPTASSQSVGASAESSKGGGSRRRTHIHIKSKQLKGKWDKWERGGGKNEMMGNARVTLSVRGIF